MRAGTRRVQGRLQTGRKASTRSSSRHRKARRIRARATQSLRGAAVARAVHPPPLPVQTPGKSSVSYSLFLNFEAQSFFIVLIILFSRTICWGRVLQHHYTVYMGVLVFFAYVQKVWSIGMFHFIVPSQTKPSKTIDKTMFVAPLHYYTGCIQIFRFTSL